MNERIKELGKLSRDYAYATEVDSIGYIDPKTQERLTWFDLYERKFAELIVKECATVSDKWDDQLPIGDMIKEHFGVEE